MRQDLRHGLRLIDAVPLADNRQGTPFERLDGPPADPSASPNANVAWITEGYCEALGVPLLAGRTLTVRDDATSQPVVIINRRLARQVFVDGDPLGKLVRIGVSTQSPFEVVGVVGDERHFGVEAEATPSFFVPRRLDPEMPLFPVYTMAQVVDKAVATPRSIAWLLSMFAVTALALAAIGVFGVMRHGV